MTSFIGATKRDHAIRRTLKGAVSGAVLALVLGGSAYAQTAVQGTDEPQGGITDIVVTAQKRAQNMQDVPVAISALSSDQLTANRITVASDLSAVVPNLTVRTQVGGSSLPVYSMRGLVALGSAQGADRGIAVYIDGVYLGAAVGSQFELAEIERIEVLRGPQGTLFGRNSTGGAIHYITPEPPADFGVRVTGTVGNYDQRRFVGRVNTGQFGPFSATLSYTHSEREGDIRNLGGGTVWDLTGANGGKAAKFTSPDRLGGSNTDAFRAALKMDVNDDLTLLYRFDYTDSRYTAPALGLTYVTPIVRAIFAAQANQALLTPITDKRPDAVNNAATVPSHNKAWGHSLTATYKASSELSFKNILAYRKLTISAPLADISGGGGIFNTGAPIFSQLAPVGFSAALGASTVGAPIIGTIASAEGQDKQWSDEFQANLDTDFVTVTAGGLYYSQTPSRGNWGEETGLGRLRSGAFRVYPGYAVPYAGQLAGTGGRITTVKIRSYAFFAQGEFHLTPQLDLVGGLRYTNDRKDGTDNTALSGTSALVTTIRYRDSRITYNLGANYKINNDVLVYGKYSTGYISGGSLGGVVYNPETAKSLEGGIKADWFDRVLRTNLAVFSVKYGNLQFPTNGTALGLSSALTSLLTNAGEARANGFELETILAPVHGLTLSAGAGFTDFKYTSLRPLVTLGQADFLVQYRPKWTLNAAAQYVTEPVAGDARLNMRLDANYRSRSSGLGGVPATFSVPTGTPALTPSQIAAEQAVYKAAAVIPAYWLVNGRIALEGFKLGGSKVTAALWGKNLFNYRGLNFVGSNTFVIAADYERARTYGIDLTVDF
ncbi:hypothetical protein V474_22980 [Novosphingobium barchaimii LL02]|uniref:TonB-denpendent receptor n=1 Tax=Novosphingobium barchaimii LL02 TaxID=1114963 RepID=A0A0J7XPM0_9SPHN|nr:TonB-dependent receptor [Novosphingobium barchaimii]KMS53627.1 hypothetical protein V474_22980 [Novosphingobium barchaimii LL02]